MLDYTLLPPEVNSFRIYTGPGVGPLVTAAQAWQSLASELSTTIAAWSSTITGISQVWRGPSSAAMIASAALYRAWLTTTATQVEQTVAQAMAAVAAYEAAFSATVPPEVVSANRALLASLVATNVLGVNTAAIAATEAHYAEMWAQDAAAMVEYQLASAAATAGLPTFLPVPAGSSPGLAAVTPISVGLGDFLGGIFAPGSDQLTTGLAGLINLFSGTTGSSFGGLLNSTIGNTIFSSGFYMPSNSILPFVALLQSERTNQLTEEGNAQAHADAVEPPADIHEHEVTPAAAVGQAQRAGRLAVPPSWCQQPGQASKVTPVAALAQNGSDGESGVMGIPGIPLAGSPSRGGEGTAPPKYGIRPIVMPRTPAGG